MNILLIILLTAAATSAVLLIVILLRARANMRPEASVDGQQDAPSVSICIPARNEAHALSACLDRALTSDYEKLEILVLDDESSDATPTLIKSFAHAGVRFIAGKPLPKGWIGKNHALDTLAREASGDYIIFADVDIHLSTDAVTNIVQLATSNNYKVLSFIPARADAHRASTLFGHMRYFWDIVMTGMGQNAASASLWCVDRRWLLSQELAGFNNVSGDIRPELVLSTKAQPNQKLLPGKRLGIAYEKRWQSQVESSIRLLLPSISSYGLHGVAMAISMIVTVCLLVALVVSFIISPTSAYIAGLIAGYLLGYVVHYVYLSMTWSSSMWFGALLWPWAIVQESVLLITSLFRYATNSVTWKGRKLDAQPENDDYYTISS